MHRKTDKQTDTQTHTHTHAHTHTHTNAFEHVMLIKLGARVQAYKLSAAVIGNH